MYKNLPFAANDEFLIEKSPQYSRQYFKQYVPNCLLNGSHATTRTAKDIKRTNPNAKLFMFITDPVERLYSHVKMCVRTPTHSCKSIERQLSGKGLIVHEETLETVTITRTVVARILHSWNSTSEGLYDYMISCRHQTQLPMTMVFIEQGNYASIVEDFNQVFDQKVYLVDGEMILKDPNQEFDLLLDFFGLEKGILHFEFNQNRGFYCLERPINYCLGGRV